MASGDHRAWVELVCDHGLCYSAGLHSGTTPGDARGTVWDVWDWTRLGLMQGKRSTRSTIALAPHFLYALLFWGHTQKFSGVTLGSTIRITLVSSGDQTGLLGIEPFGRVQGKSPAHCALSQVSLPHSLSYLKVSGNLTSEEAVSAFLSLLQRLV